jgi:hypothetical protein
MVNNLSKLKGGVGDNTPTNQVDANQLSIGVQVEMEHTNDLDIAKEIAMDHLTEDPEYYTKLIKAGLASEFQPSHNSGFGDPNQSFNDSSRVGHGGLKKGNIHGKMGNTSIGQVDGRNSEPIINKTIDIELEEQVFNSLEEAILDEKKRRKKGGKKRKPKPTNPALWARAKAAARSKFDVYPSAYANGWAARWYKSKGGGWRMSEAYPAQAMESPFPSSASSDGQGTFGGGYDFIGYAENKQETMNKQQLKETIKKMIREIEQEDDVNVDAEKDSVTITLDRELAKKLHALLMTKLQPEQPENDEAQDQAPTMDQDQLPPQGSAGGEAETGEIEDVEEQDSVGEITFEQSQEIDETKKKWIQKAIHPGKKGALKKALHVPAGEKIPAGKLAAAAKKGGKVGQRARLAMTLRKLKESL